MSVIKFIIHFLVFYITMQNANAQSTEVKSNLQNADSAVIVKKKYFKKRITAAILTVTLGPLGAHRLYLGTQPQVPAMYLTTIGGGVGLIPLIDLIAILTTKDLSIYENNKKVLMWLKN